MRRALALLAAAAIVAVALTAAGGEQRSYRVDAVFANAAGLIPGQNVEIAGAVVGQVADIELTPDHRARVGLEVRSGFAPFHADAECEIKPQSLIGEKSVACDPGSPDARELTGHGGAPTVPLAQTHTPVDIDLIFGALRRPYVERLSLVVNELGTGLAGRPQDLQAAIRRAAPALEEFDRVLRIVNRDRSLLGELIDRSDTVLAEAARRDGDVTRFIDRATRAGEEVAQRRDALGSALDRLPPLLAELEPSARSLASVARDARPVVHELSRATPSLRDLFGDLAPLTDAGRPALAALRAASDEGRQAVAAARPIAKRLRPATALLPHVAEVGAAVLRSLREAGAPEGIQKFVWLGTASMARFDATSHIVPSYQLGGACNRYSTTELPGCSAHWASYRGAPPVAKQKKARRGARRGTRVRPGGEAGDDGAQAPATAPDPPATRRPGLLDRLPELPPLPKLPGSGAPDGGDTGDDSAGKLLDFLLGR